MGKTSASKTFQTVFLHNKVHPVFYFGGIGKINKISSLKAAASIWRETLHIAGEEMWLQLTISFFPNWTHPSICVVVLFSFLERWCLRPIYQYKVHFIQVTAIAKKKDNTPLIFHSLFIYNKDKISVNIKETEQI